MQSGPPAIIVRRWYWPRHEIRLSESESGFHVKDQRELGTTRQTGRPMPPCAAGQAPQAGERGTELKLPKPGGPRYVSDGGLETDLIYHYGFDLPEFAAFPLVHDAHGRAELAKYYAKVADVARRARVGALFEAPTWRANPDWGGRLGYDSAALDEVNREAIALLRKFAKAEPGVEVVVAGVVGPRGDGYVAGERADVDEAAAYHRAQLESFASAGADLAVAYTLTGPEEAAGIVRSANAVGLPIAISFTVETDGRLPDGNSLAAAIKQVDTGGEVAYFGVNCAHPSHIEPALEPGDWLSRIGSLLPNASAKTHAELDASEELDEGDPATLAQAMRGLRDKIPSVAVIGGCCGTDARHVAMMWGVAEV
jgi:homocysteine S-methyltransferase